MNDMLTMQLLLPFRLHCSVFNLAVNLRVYFVYHYHVRYYYCYGASYEENYNNCDYKICRCQTCWYKATALSP